MNQIVLSEIENNISSLPADVQLQLISRVAERLRRKIEAEPDFEQQLAAMAQDIDIQRELKEIEADFCRTEFDGLAE